MMTVSGVERCTTETLSASSSGEGGRTSFTSLRKTGVTNSGVGKEKSDTTKSVDDALMILAISRTTPGAMSCMLMAVISTSSGTLSSTVNALATRFPITRSPARSRRRAGDIVTFIVTVA